MSTGKQLYAFGVQRLQWNQKPTKSSNWYVSVCVFCSGLAFQPYFTIRDLWLRYHMIKVHTLTFSMSLSSNIMI